MVRCYHDCTSNNVVSTAYQTIGDGVDEILVSMFGPLDRNDDGSLKAASTPHLSCSWTNDTKSCNDDDANWEPDRISRTKTRKETIPTRYGVHS